MSNSKELTAQLLDSYDGNILLIDGDSIAFLIGWHHREHQEIDKVKEAVDMFLKELFLLSGTAGYLGVVASPGKNCFRYGSYKFKPYKGNRKPTEEGDTSMDWIKFWQPIIDTHLIDAHGFVYAPMHLETDDVIIAVHEELRSVNSDLSVVISSPDKDLRQVPGKFYNYKPKMNADGTAVYEGVVEVDPSTAKRNWCMQMIMGDTTDNIAGIPGMGEKKAAEMLKSLPEIQWINAIKMLYQEKFGPYYGPKIYAETEAAVTMLNSKHPMIESLKFPIPEFVLQIKPVKSKYAQESPFSEEAE